MTKSSGIPILDKAALHGTRTAIVDSQGTYTFDGLIDASCRIAAKLLTLESDLSESRVAFLIPPGFGWVAVLWGIWRSGGIAVPLPLGATWPELEYILEDTGASTLVLDMKALDARSLLQFEATSSKRHLRLLACDDLMDEVPKALPEVSTSRRAMILYTSGTTNRPKGVVTTHANITAQIKSLISAWEWSQNDGTVLCLPLHHVHGIINVVSCALWSGATCEMLTKFDANVIWDRIASGRLTLFMAVPTIYARLIAAWEAASFDRRAKLSGACATLRLMVSGSAALPASTLERWREISHQTLLERYGMTEIGMALSNSYRGERVPGSVGKPLPGVDVQLVGENGDPVAAGVEGEIEVRGPGVFGEYWGKPEATREAFRDGWFRTGDTAVVENGIYRILGRTSIDILKTGGHKVSALEIEEVLRNHPGIGECAVVGVPDAEWGERVAAAIVLKESAQSDTTGRVLDLPSLRNWARELLTAHKIPSRLLILDALPRNAMGKVLKPAVSAMFQTAESPNGQ